MATPAHTVLIVDDETDLRETVAEFFDANVFNILLAESVAAADQQIRHAKVDLIICDYLLQNGKGSDLLKTLRDRGDQTPFILMTGMEDFWNAGDTPTGSLAVIKKPFSAKDLRSLVDLAFKQGGGLKLKVDQG